MLFPDPVSLSFSDLLANLQFWESQGHVWKEGWSRFWLEVGNNAQSFQTFTSIPWVQKDMVRRCSGHRNVWTQEALLSVQFRTLPILNIVIANNVPLLQRVVHTAESKRFALQQCVNYGKLKCLRYVLRVTQKPIAWPQQSLERLVARGYLKCLKLALQHGLAWNRAVTCRARTKGILNFIRKERLPVCDTMWTTLVHHGSLDFWRTGLDFVGPPTQAVLVDLAKFGTVHKLKCLLHHSLDWPVDFVCLCVVRNDLEMIQVALRHGASWEIRASAIAAQFNLPKIIDFALENEFLIHPDTTLQAFRHGHKRLLKKLWDHPKVWKHPAVSFSN